MTPEFFSVYPAMTRNWNAGGRQAHNVEQAMLIVREIASGHKVHASHIMGPFRDRESVRARADVIRRLNSMGWNASSIARFLDRDHSTINHALGKRRKRSGYRGRLQQPRLVPTLDL